MCVCKTIKRHFSAQVLFVWTIWSHIWSHKLYCTILVSHNNYTSSTTPTSSHDAMCTFKHTFALWSDRRVGDSSASLFPSHSVQLLKKRHSVILANAAVLRKDRCEHKKGWENVKLAQHLLLNGELRTIGNMLPSMEMQLQWRSSRQTSNYVKILDWQNTNKNRVNLLRGQSFTNRIYFSHAYNCTFMVCKKQ